MSRRPVPKTCLRCKYFHPVDQATGKCRVDRGVVAPADYPVKRCEEHCPSWRDAGQQYFIRVGWIRRLTEAGEARGSGPADQDDTRSR